MHRSSRTPSRVPGNSWPMHRPPRHWSWRAPHKAREPCLLRHGSRTGGGDPRQLPARDPETPRSDEGLGGYPPRRGSEAMPRPIGSPWHVRTNCRRDLRPSVLGDLDPALAHGVDDGLGAVVDGQLAQDGRHVVLHRLLADGQRVGDLLVGHALGDVVQDLHLAR
jgi:hypothetical protein